MSEQEPVFKDIKGFAEALGGKAIYVGNISVHDILSGDVVRRIEIAKKAREIAEKDPDQLGPIERAIRELVFLVDTEVPGQSDLTEVEKEAIAWQVENLVGIN